VTEGKAVQQMHKKTTATFNKSYNKLYNKSSGA